MSDQVVLPPNLPNRASDTQAPTKSSKPLVSSPSTPPATRPPGGYCPDCKVAKLIPIDMGDSYRSERLPNGTIKLPWYVWCTDGCGYLRRVIQKSRHGKLYGATVPDRIQDRWRSVDLRRALGEEPESCDHKDCYVAQVSGKVEFGHVGWNPVEALGS